MHFMGSLFIVSVSICEQIFEDLLKFKMFALLCLCLEFRFLKCHLFLSYLMFLYSNISERAIGPVSVLSLHKTPPNLSWSLIKLVSRAMGFLPSYHPLVQWTHSVPWRCFCLSNCLTQDVTLGHISTNTDAFFMRPRVALICHLPFSFLLLHITDDKERFVLII